MKAIHEVEQCCQCDQHDDYPECVLRGLHVVCEGVSVMSRVG